MSFGHTLISRSRYFEIESEAPVGRKPEVSPLIIGESWMRWRIVVFNDVVSILKLYIHFFHTLDYIQWHLFINKIFFLYIIQRVKNEAGMNYIHILYWILSSNSVNRGSSFRLVVQGIVVYLYFRGSSHRSLTFKFKMAAAWNQRISRARLRRALALPIQPHCIDFGCSSIRIPLGVIASECRLNGSQWGYTAKCVSFTRLPLRNLRFYCRFCKFNMGYRSKVEWTSTYFFSISYRLSCCCP